MKKIFKNLLTIIKYVFLFILFLYEELFLIPATKILNKIKTKINYQKIIEAISQNYFTMLLFLVISLILAEISAILAGFLIIKGYWIGGLLYIVKILIFVPLVDIFKHNKKKLLKIKIIKTLYYYYLLFLRLDFIKKIKKLKKNNKTNYKRKNNFIKKWINYLFWKDSEALLIVLIKSKTPYRQDFSITSSL